MADALDIEQPEQLAAYLRRGGYLRPGETVVSRVLPGGVSNRVVLVERSNGDAWVLKQALSKLRVAVDWFSSPERIHREALGLRWLSRLDLEPLITHAFPLAEVNAAIDLALSGRAGKILLEP